MDITHLSLFSGIGGIDLAAEWAGIRTIGQCEWAEYPTKVLERHWPDVPRWKDIRTLTGESFYERTGRRTVDIISGGFPCQPFSVAGKQRGKEDDRYLWPEMVRVIKELRPAWVVGENVAGIVRMALPDILSELEACGYRTRTFLIPACAVGARHRRYRVAIVAYTDPEWELQSTGSQQDVGDGTGISCKTLADAESQLEGRLPVREKSEQPGFSVGCKDVQHAHSAGCKEQHIPEEPDQQEFPGRRCNEGNICNTTVEGLPDRSGKSMERQEQEQESERPMRRPTESLLGGMVDGIPGWMDRDLDFLINHYWDEEPGIKRIASGITHRTDRIKCLGNAVVPQQFFPIFKAIKEIEDA